MYGRTNAIETRLSVGKRVFSLIGHHEHHTATPSRSCKNKNIEGIAVEDFICFIFFQTTSHLDP